MMFIHAIDNNKLNSGDFVWGAYQEKYERWYLYQDIIIIFWVGNKPKNWQNCVACISVKIEIFLSAHYIFVRLMGLVG